MKNLFKKFLVVLDLLLNKLNYVVEGIIKARPYSLDWTDVLREKKKQGIEDLVEFATFYTFYWHEKHNKKDNIDSKKKMHADILEGLLVRQEG